MSSSPSKNKFQKVVCFEDFEVIKKLGGLEEGKSSFAGWNSVVFQVRYKGKEEYAMKILKVLKGGDFENFSLHQSPSEELLSSEISRRKGIRQHRNVVEVLHSFSQKFKEDQLKRLEFSFYPYFRGDMETFETVILIMEYFPKSLKTLIEKNGYEMEEEEFLGIFGDILEGACHIHRFGFVHRDIKMENIYIRDDGSVAIGDFCWLLDCNQCENFQVEKKGHRPKGFPRFMPNEIQFIDRGRKKNGETGFLDYSKVDAFAVGCTLYECLERQHAYKNVKKKQQDTFRPMKNKKVSKELKEIVKGLCKVDFDQRFTLERALEMTVELLDDK